MYVSIKNVIDLEGFQIRNKTVIPLFMFLHYYSLELFKNSFVIGNFFIFILKKNHNNEINRNKNIKNY